MLPACPRAHWTPPHNAHARRPACRCAGALYWQGWVEGTTAVWWTLDPAGRWGILTTDPAYSSVADFALAANALSGQPFPCPADRPLLNPVFPPVLDCPEGCAPGWRGRGVGRPAPGGMPALADVSPQPRTPIRSFEGPDCNTDINECVRGTDDCDGAWLGGCRGIG